MKNIDAVCHNLKRFLEWAYSDCTGGCGAHGDDDCGGDKAPRGSHKINRLVSRCENIIRIKNEIHSNAAKSLVDDIERANRDIIKHNIQQHKSDKQRYQSMGPSKKGRKEPKKSKKSKKAKNNKN